MEKIQSIVNNSKDIETLVGVINLTCELAEKSQKNSEDKLNYAVRMFHVVAKELNKHGKISDEILQECEKITEQQLSSYIKEVIELWNKAVPIIKRIKKVLNKLKLCRK